MAPLVLAQTYHCIECPYPEEQVSFCLVLYMHTHIRKNQEECGQIWSGSTHYPPLSGIERTQEGKGEKIRFFFCIENIILFFPTRDATFRGKCLAYNTHHIKLHISSDFHLTRSHRLEGVA